MEIPRDHSKRCITLGSVSDVPEFRALIGQDAAEQLEARAADLSNDVEVRKALQRCFTCMMQRSKEEYAKQLKLLVQRVTQQGTQFSLLLYEYILILFFFSLVEKRKGLFIMLLLFPTYF